MIAALILWSMVPESLAGYPSAADWRDVVVYQIITDRFYDGNPANNNAEGGYNPSDGRGIHGGDFAGIEAKLDYIEALGAGAIWISPVVLNTNAEYHGYAARDFFSIAPHFGSLAELQNLVDAAHARGIYVFIDVVTNHMGTLVGSRESGYPDYRYPDSYQLSWENPAKRYFGVFDDLDRFHAHGHIGDFSDPEQVLGELFGLDDLKTEDPVVRDQLVHAARWLIQNTDCDGFRIDTVKHVEMDFWNEWSPRVRAAADSSGKANFFQFGEVFDGSDGKNGSYTGTQSGGSFKLDSVLYFPMHFTAQGVFIYDDPPAAISWRYGFLESYDPASRERLLPFLDNHDMARFLAFGGANQDESRLHAALGWLLTARGVPVLYYGTEQEFDGGGDPYSREDMWDGEWDFGPSEGDNFDLVHPLFLFTQRLLTLRKQHEALRQGTTTELFAESAGPGLYVFGRETGMDTVLVAVNTANSPLTQTVSGLDWLPDTPLVDAMDEHFRTSVDNSQSVSLPMPARSVRILESGAFRAALPSPSPLRITSVYPGHDGAVNDAQSPLSIHFDRDVVLSSVQSAFAISPEASGMWQVQGRVARYYPAGGWRPSTTYRWSLGATVEATDGGNLALRFEAMFHTGGVSTGITVPGGFVVDEIARQGLTSSEAVLHAPAVSDEAILLADTKRDRLFTLTPGGDLGHWLGDNRWAKPEGLANGPRGELAVVASQGAYVIDSLRMATEVAGASNATLVGAVAWGGEDYAEALHLCDPQNDRIVRVAGDGSLQTFALGIKGAEGLAFGPGGTWGTHLYVADADLTSLGTPAEGPGRIVRFDPGGVVAEVLSDPALLSGAGALAFDTQGRFGGSLYVADILNERIIQVTEDGSASVFASGFHNLSGSHCLAFGPDGALYVADPGSGQSFSNSNGDHPPRVLRIAREDSSTDVPQSLPLPFAVYAPFPNPTRGSAVIRFALPRETPVRLVVFNVKGQLVRDLGSETFGAGSHTRSWDARDDNGRAVPAGLYFLSFEIPTRTVTKRLVVLR